MIALLLSPVGRILGAGVGVVLFLSAFYVWASGKGEAACQMRIERAVAAEQQRQSLASASALDNARRQADASRTEASGLQNKVLEYETLIASRPVGGHCTISADDARRLLDIR